MPQQTSVSAALPAAGPAGPLPLAILTGFLGSGKTTFLRRLLADPAMSDTAVVINEFGEIGLDHLLLESAPDRILQLPNGCVCCAVRQDLVLTLHSLLRRREAGHIAPFRRIVLETSGLAEPSPILYTLSADALLEASLALAGVTTMIDAVAGHDSLRRYAEATAQVAVADVLLVSKADIAPPPDALLQRLADLNPTAGIAIATAIHRPADLLFRPARADGPAGLRPRQGRRWAASAEHSFGIRSFTIVLHRDMTRLEFAQALGGLARDRGEDLLRVKGLVGFADRPGRPAAIHVVQHTMYPPSWLDAWPDHDHTSRLVLIARNLPPDEVIARFGNGEAEALR